MKSFRLILFFSAISIIFASFDSIMARADLLWPIEHPKRVTGTFGNTGGHAFITGST